MANPNVSKVGDFLTPRSLSGGTLTAGGSGDASEVTSDYVDRLDYESATLVVAGIATIASNKELDLTVKIADSADHSSWSSDTTLATAVKVAGTLSAGSWVYRLDLNLAQYNRYVRFKFTPDLTATSVDTAQWGAALVLGGAVIKPAAAT